MVHRPCNRLGRSRRQPWDGDEPRAPTNSQQGSAATTSQCLQSRALTEAFFFPSSYPAPTAALATSPLLVLLPGSSCCCSCLCFFFVPLFGLLLLLLFPSLFPSTALPLTLPAATAVIAAMAQPAWTQADPMKPSVSTHTPIWDWGAHIRATHCTPAVNGNNHRKLYLGLGDLSKLKVEVITIYFINNAEY